MATAELPESRLQASPLPLKRGEIGYQEDVHEEARDEGSNASQLLSPLPQRHPADTPLPPDILSANDTPVVPSMPNVQTPNVQTPTDTPSPTEPPNTAAPLNPSGNAGQKFASFIGCKCIPTVWGLRVTTLSLFSFQICLLAATIAGWVILVQRMQASGASSKQDQGQGGMSMNSALIFVYAAFAMLVLVQVIFLERCIFRLRAERYAYVHPGEVLPSHRNRASSHSPGLAFTPWNRPSLPTYAAALAQSGAGTGDVEDNIIAQPPPPAYGEHRQSQLLLRGEVSEQLRAQRLRDSTGSQRSDMSWMNIRRISVRSIGGPQDGPRLVVESDERPKSYMSMDPEWEAALDADRAAVLEAALTKLEEGEAETGVKTE